MMTDWFIEVNAKSINSWELYGAAAGINTWEQYECFYLGKVMAASWTDVTYKILVF